MDKDRIKQMIESEDFEMLNLGVTILCNSPTLGLQFAGGFDHIRDRIIKKNNGTISQRFKLLQTLQSKHLQELRRRK